MTPVAYIMSRFPKLTETFILREILELERQGQPVMILPLLRVRQPVRHADVDRVLDKVHAVPLLSWRLLSANLAAVWRSPRRYFSAWALALRGTWGSANLFLGAFATVPQAVYFARVIERAGVRHVHAHYATHPALAALITAELTGVSFSFTAHAHDIFVHTTMLGEKLRRARFIAAISEFNKRYLLRFNPEAGEKIHVVHCGVDLSRYQPQPRRADRMFTLLCVAGLEPYKGLPHLIRACAQMRSALGRFHCLIVGEGRERRNLERLIAELDLTDTVQLLGALPQERLAGLFGQADLCILPSVVASDGQMEGIPVALMEAMASGLPVVATRLSGIPELVQDGVTGILVDPGDEHALAEAVIQLAADDGARTDMGRRGREHVAAHFELSATVGHLRALFAPDGRGWESRMKELIMRHVNPGGHLTVELHRRQQGHDSDVYTVTLQNGSRHPDAMILKRHRPAVSLQQDDRGLEASQRAARREYEALSSLWNAFSIRSDRLGVPRPLALFPEGAAVLMELCDGRRLDRMLRWTRLRAIAGREARLRQDLTACGEWLGMFHQITERSGNPSAIYHRIEQDFSEELARCRAQGLREDIAQRVQQHFTAAKAAAFGGSDRLVGRHCDFGPYNIFLSPGRMTAIDFEGFQDGIRYDDLCYFLGMIESVSWYHLSAAQRRRLAESFLDGYSRYGTLDRGSQESFMLAAMVKIMARSPLLQGKARRGPDAWKRATRVAQYNHWFEQHAQP